jgi:4-hydroxy-tetrahydrodipicolinate synthase
MSEVLPAPITGVWSPVVTPFGVDGDPSFPHLLKHATWLVQQECGLALFGTNSEGNSLSVDEKRDLLQQLVASGIPPGLLLPGVGSCSIRDAVALSTAAVGADCAGVLCLPPFYYKVATDDGLFAFFSELIERVGSDRLRIYLYHIPPVAGIGFSHDLIGRLIRRYGSTIAGIKDTGGDWVYTQETISTFGGPQFSVLAGTEAILLKTMRAGGAGCISATANVNPGGIVSLFQNWRDADADKRQKALNTIRGAFTNFPMIAAQKAAIADGAQDEAWSRLRVPMEPLAEHEREALRRALSELSFSVPNFCGEVAA